MCAPTPRTDLDRKPARKGEAKDEPAGMVTKMGNPSPAPRQPSPRYSVRTPGSSLLVGPTTPRVAPGKVRAREGLAQHCRVGLPGTAARERRCRKTARVPRSSGTRNAVIATPVRGRSRTRRSRLGNPRALGHAAGRPRRGPGNPRYHGAHVQVQERRWASGTRTISPTPASRARFPGQPPLGQTPPSGRSVGSSRPVLSLARCRRCPPPGPASRRRRPPPARH